VQYLEGPIRSILFYKEENHFAIAKIEARRKSASDSLLDFPDEVKTVKGHLPHPKKGEVYRFFGEFETHPKYGTQFKFQRYERLEEASEEGLVEYLSSDLFPGVGKKSAERIVKTLGTDALQKISDDDSALEEVPSLSKKARTTLKQHLHANKATENTRIKLLGYGISHRLIDRILKVYEARTAEVIEDNPYQLIETVEGIGFERADLIAKKLDIPDDDPRRIRAFLITHFQEIAASRGHTHIEKSAFLEEAHHQLSKHVDIPETVVASSLESLIEEGRFIFDGEALTLKHFKESEESIAKRLFAFSQGYNEAAKQKVSRLIKSFEDEKGITYTDEQRRAIEAALSHQAIVLTGGPGTGKTTVIEGIVEVARRYFDYEGPRYDEESDIHLIAPTGRAAKRMNETTGAYACTIHRFLGYGYDGSFAHDETAPKPGSLFIIDEASMIDISLAAHLFRSLPDEARLVIVGDEAQLPSVGPGQVLKDIIDSGLLATITLHDIHRQARESKVVDLARHVRDGGLPDDLLKTFPDRYIFKERPERFHERLGGIIDYFLDKGYDLHEDIQVLIPMYKGPVGIHETNRFLQSKYNPNTEKAIDHGERTFRIGDKVLQLINQPEDNVMNGDQGVIVGIDDTSSEVIVSFMGNEVTYRYADLKNLTHAYAMSVHKSQGSEYSVVVFPLFKRHSILLKRKLIYTGITRTEKTLVMLGEIEVLSNAIRYLEERRATKLRQKLEDTLQREGRKTSIDDALERLEKEEQEAPTPYDFMEGRPPPQDMTPDVTPYIFEKNGDD